MSDLDLLDLALAEVASGKRIAYLGPEVSALSGGTAPTTPEALCEVIEAQVRPRSGLATRHGVTLPNSPGTIDSDYRGEVFVPLINHGSAPFVVEHGMRIAQMVIAPVVLADAIEVDSLDETDRGSGGFGSTGL